MRVDAALADQPQRWKSLEQRCTHRGPLSDQNDRLEVAQSLGQGVEIFEMIGEDGHVVAVELCVARKPADGVEVIVEDRDLH
jgi:hypothetical protein